VSNRFGLASNHWLQVADRNYIEGRFLWLHGGIDGACILLWLAVEQITKLICLQADPERGLRDNDDLDQVYAWMDRRARQYSRRHRWADLEQSLGGIPGAAWDLEGWRSTIEKLEEYFHRRYVRNESTSIRITMFREVDTIYFNLRDSIEPDVVAATIDEIYVRRKHGLQQPVPVYEHVYRDNPQFRTRPHPLWKLKLPDGRIVDETGR
jgi:hypothetical protein